RHVLTRPSAVCFFFSSRRRHTRFSRDWSSDVCSSDLLPERGQLLHLAAAGPPGVEVAGEDDQGEEQAAQGEGGGGGHRVTPVIRWTGSHQCRTPKKPSAAVTSRARGMARPVCRSRAQAAARATVAMT